MDQAAVATHPSTPPQGPGLHPLLHAGRWLVSDMLSTLAFVALYAVTDNIYLATGLGIAFGFAQIAFMKWRGTQVDVLQWMSLGLVCVFGGATLATRNPVFIMLKPTLIYTAVGAVMLRPGWMNRYMPPIALARGGDIVFAFGYVWAGLMFVTAAANLVLALYTDKHTWEWFLGVFPLGSKLALFAIQYITTRVIVRRRILAEMPGGNAAAAT